jgi:cytochrome c-type biogenesis protein
MNELILSAFGCLTLGIMTTLHPCPLTTNIAAISYISGVSQHRSRQVFALVMFSLGYMFALIGIAMVLNFSMVAIPTLSLFLQRVISAFLGPLLILAGMVLSELIKLKKYYKGFSLGRKKRHGSSVLYSFLIGLMLALAFCPATASLYFGVMIPMSIKSNQIILFPLLYAAGAVLPIVMTSIFINRGLTNMLKDRWIRKVPILAGWILIILGIYITLEQLYF